MLGALPKNKACGQDRVSARLSKETIIIITIAPSLTNLFNFSIRTGIFSRDWKLAKVTPIYKDDKKCIPDNYNLPITNFCITSYYSVDRKKYF